MLLKNDKSTLPLKAGTKIALVGPHALGREVFLSNYHGTNTVVDSNSPLAALGPPGWAKCHVGGHG